MVDPINNTVNIESRIADAYYEGYKDLPEHLRKRLSLNDLHLIYINMVKPAILAYAEGCGADTAASVSRNTDGVEGSYIDYGVHSWHKGDKP